jgi:hypothetical protein
MSCPVRRDVRRDTDVEDHQGIYDAASARQAMTRLVLSYWRARRLCAGVEALGTAMRQHDPDGNDRDDGVDQAGEPVSALGEVWRLTTSAASQGLLGILARLSVTDAATAIVVQTRRRHRPAGRPG